MKSTSTQTRPFPAVTVAEVPLAADEPRSRSTPALKERLIDSSPAAIEELATPTTLRRARRARRRSRWRARLVILIVLAACVAVGFVQVSERIERRDRVPFSAVILSASSIDVVTTSPGNVLETLVGPGDEVVAGDVVAVIDAIRPDTEGGERRVVTELEARVDGVVAAIPVQVGAAVRSGDIVARLYRPDSVLLQVEVPLERSTELEIGMTGEFQTRGFDAIPASLVAIEPALSTAADGRGVAILQFLPDDLDDIADLPLGLPFDGWIDTSSA